MAINQYFNTIIDDIAKIIKEKFPEKADTIIKVAENNTKQAIASHESSREPSTIEKMNPDQFTKV